VETLIQHIGRHFFFSENASYDETNYFPNDKTRLIIITERIEDCWLKIRLMKIKDYFVAFFERKKCMPL